MATVREKLLPVVSRLRGIADTKMGLRRYSVFVRRETPSDGRGGAGALWTVVDTTIAERPRARPANERDLYMAAGRVTAGDWVLDRITPRNDADTTGTKLDAYNLRPDADGQKVFLVLVGPDMPAYVAGPPPSGGGLFTVEVADASRNFGFQLVLHPVTGRR